MIAATANKAITKARATGKLSLVAVTKMNLFRYYMDFAQEQINLGVEEYKDKYQTLVNKFNGLANSCPDIICNIREASCSSGQYESGSTGSVRNPYNPTTPVTPVEPPEPDTHVADVEDITIYADYNTVTPLTIAMFDSKFTDSDGHSYDAVRIDKINSTNIGIFYVLGVPISEGQIITRDQIINGDFTHVGSDAQSIMSDSFDFSVRDDSTGEWIE